MAITYQKFFEPVVLTTSAATYYTVPSTPASNLLRTARVRFTNTTGTAATVTAYAVPLAGTATAANAFLSARSVPANDFIDTDVPVLKAGDFLSALAGTDTAITMHFISGALFS